MRAILIGPPGAASGAVPPASFTDFAWITPAALLTADVLIPVAPGDAPTVQPHQAIHKG